MSLPETLPGLILEKGATSLGRGAALLLVSLLTLTLPFFLLTIQQSWLWSYHALPTALFAIHSLVYVGLCALFNWVRGPEPLKDLALGLVLLLWFLSITMGIHVGDYHQWVLYSHGRIIYKSEILSNLTYILIRRGGLSISCVPPAVGFLVSQLYFLLGRSLLPPRSTPLGSLYRLAFPGLGIFILFFHDYVENTLLGIPFFLLYLHQMIRYLRVRTDRGTWTSLALATFSLLLACLFHGVYVFLAPSLVLIILYGNIARRTVPLGLLQVALSLILMAGATMLVFSLLRGLGFDLMDGNTSGGPDSMRFTPLSSMLSLAGPSQTANIIVFTSPLSLFLLPVLIANARRAGHWRDALRAAFPGDDAVLFVLAISSLGFLAFVTLWHFDLGFPWDLDLMIAAGFPLSLCLLFIASHAFAQHRASPLLPVLLSFCYTSLFSSFFLAPNPWIKPTTYVSTKDVSIPKPEGYIWQGAGNQIFTDSIEVELPGRQQAHFIEISLDCNDRYALVYLLEGKEVARQVINPKPIAIGGLAHHLVDVPGKAKKEGYDTLRVTALEGDGIYTLGHVRIIQSRRDILPQNKRARKRKR